MSDALVALTLVTALGCGLVAGTFFAFSNFAMKGLGEIPAPSGIAAMQSINRTVINPLFMLALFGSGATCLALVIAAAASWDDGHGPYLVAGGALYVLGTVGVTMAFNVPRNNVLEKLDPSTAEAMPEWRRYLREWTTWNTVRTVAALAATAALIGGLYVD